MKHAKAKAPGKLYIAGEYAVVTPGHPAVIIAVDRFISVSLSPSKEYFGKIFSSSISENTLIWKRQNQQIILEEPNKKADIILKTLELTEHFLKEHNILLPYYDIYIKSDLDSVDGIKYGLGSSGAVTVATIHALLKSVNLDSDNEKLFKLAAIVHVSLNKKGSLGDLAAAVYTGWLAYSSPDREWVKHQWNRMGLSSLIDEAWPKLKIESIKAPKSVELLVGWTGHPASTDSFVTSLEGDKDIISYDRFLKDSTTCVSHLIKGIQSDSNKEIKKAINNNRLLLLQMSRSNNFILETPKLTALNQIAKKHGAVAKSSGAGGGDCGIAFVDTRFQKEGIYKDWRANSIEPLSLNMYDKYN